MRVIRQFVAAGGVLVAMSASNDGDTVSGPIYPNNFSGLGAGRSLFFDIPVPAFPWP